MFFHAVAIFYINNVVVGQYRGLRKWGKYPHIARWPPLVHRHKYFRSNFNRVFRSWEKSSSYVSLARSYDLSSVYSFSVNHVFTYVMQDYLHQRDKEINLYAKDVTYYVKIRYFTSVDVCTALNLDLTPKPMPARWWFPYPD